MNSLGLLYPRIGKEELAHYFTQDANAMINYDHVE
jgi:hypothetical protein